MKHEISYGKHAISIYRSYARPLRVESIPESSFTGRRNALLAAVVTVDVLGGNFLPAYTEGDNSMVVATDTMKNFTYAGALEYGGATLEGLAAFLARRFLETYPHMERVRVRCEEIPFREVSDRLLAWAGGDRGLVEVEMSAAGLLSARFGRLGMRLVKLTGSAFADFQRDRYTTLPEVRDRPLQTWLDVSWRYLEPEPALSGEADAYVPSEQVRDLCEHTVDGFVSMSIQHLVHEMGTRILDRFPRLGEVAFEAQNRTWDTSATSEADPLVRVFSDPKPAHGNITLRLTRA